MPAVVIADGASLYPAVLAEVRPQAAHQLGVFHVPQGITAAVLDAGRRTRRARERRGRGGRKGKRGRPKKGPKGRAASKGPANEGKAAVVFKRGYLVGERPESQGEQERADLKLMFGYGPDLKGLWRFRQEVDKPWQAEQRRTVGRWRWARLVGKPGYQRVEELAGVLGWLEGEKVAKTQASCGQPRQERQKTNNHVERMNRRPRFDAGSTPGNREHAAEVSGAGGPCSRRRRGRRRGAVHTAGGTRRRNTASGDHA